MKASTAINLLKSTRARIDVWGIAQIGPHEVMAIAFALTKIEESSPHAEGLTNLKKGFFEIMVKRTLTGISNGGMVEIDEGMYEGIRAAYKTLANVSPDEDYQLPTLEEALQEAADKIIDKSKPAKKFDPTKFLKGMGIDPDIEPKDDEDPETDTSIT